MTSSPKSIASPNSVSEPGSLSLETDAVAKVAEARSVRLTDAQRREASLAQALKRNLRRRKL